MLTMNRLALLGSACLIASVLSHCGDNNTTTPDLAQPDMAMGDMAQPKPAPTITAVSPNSATTAGTGMLTITGTDFQTGATVTVGGTACANPTVTATSITCTIPAKAMGCGAAAVVVTNPDMQSTSLGTGFTYRTAMVSYATPVTVATGMVPGRVVIADLNNDNKPDVATANVNGNNISVMINNGTGGLMAATNINAGTGPSGIVVADMNGDGKPDLVAVNATTANISVFLNTGGGMFMAAQNSITSLVNTNAIAIADINGDKNADVVTRSSTVAQVSVRLGNGMGGFQGAAGTLFNVAGNSGQVAFADINGDNKLDIVATNQTTNNVSVLIGNGMGSFGAATNFNTGTGSFGLAVVDIDNDTKLDVVTANNGANNVSILRNTTTAGAATPTFMAAQNLGTANTPETVKVADMNNDGILDILTSNAGNNTFSYLQGMPNNMYATTVNTMSGGMSNFGFDVGDLNGDGLRDLVIGNGSQNQVSVRIQQCQ